MNWRGLSRGFEEVPFTRHMLLDLLKAYKRPNDKMNELVKAGDLISVRRGLFIAGPNSELTPPEPFLIANHLRGPSYVSLESALSFWGLIPEKVYEILSVTTRTAKKYDSPAGRFNFEHLPSPYYSFGIDQVPLTPRQTILIASREKALCDKIILSAGIVLRSVAQTKDFLLDDLRMDEALLRELKTNTIHSWLTDAPKASSLKMLIKTLESL